MRVIGFGGKIGHGKSTAAKLACNALADAGISSALVPFAAELKRIAVTEFGWDGKKDERGRTLLQLLGTEVGRGYDLDMWIKKLERYVKGDLPEGTVAVVDDCRFINEVEWVKRHGIAIFVQRPDAPQISQEAAAHVSETEVMQAQWTVLMENVGTIEDLKLQVTQALAHFGFLTPDTTAV